MSGKTLLLACNSSFGLANFRMGLIRRLQSDGYRVVAVAPRDAHSVQLEAAGVEFHDWRLAARSTHLWTEIQAIVQLTRIYRQVRPDLCFHYTVKAVIYGAIAAPRARARFVSVITGLGYIFLNDGMVSRLARVLYRMLLRHSYRVWFLNLADREEFLRLGLVSEGLVDVIPGEGVDIDYFRPVARAEIIEEHRPTDFLVVSRLLTDKGILEFVEAVRLLRSRGFRLTARLLGARGTENPSAIDSNLVDSWEREGLVVYLGSASDVRPFLASTDCVVLPSYREGLPRALLEASATGCPVIATAVPGCRDVVIDGETGLLCAPRDPVALAASMERFLSMSFQERALMGRKGRALVESRFAESTVIEKYLELLKA